MSAPSDFSTLGLDPRVLAAVVDAGYTTPTPIQAEAIPTVLVGTDLVGIAQTGTGKTAAFMLPLLSNLAARPARGTQVLVLAPTRELAAQIVDNAQAYAKHLPLRIAAVFGGVGERPQINALRAGVEVIVACPGRLEDLLGRRHGDLHGLRHLVLDEADRMLDMGFLPSIRRIIKGLPKERQTLMFSATLSPEIESLTREFQRSPKKVEIGRRSNPAATVSQWVYELGRHQKLAMLAHLLAKPEMESVLVFCRTRHGADRVARKLEQFGIIAGVMHSDRSQGQRQRALADFKDGVARVLVATDIVARGIDVDGISHVVNFDLPPHADDYVHRIGRTGRAGCSGASISFVTPEDEAALVQLERSFGRGIPRARAEGFDYSTEAPLASVPRAGLVMPGRSKPGGPKGGGGKPGAGGGKSTAGGKIAAWKDPAKAGKAKSAPKKDWRHK